MPGTSREDLKGAIAAMHPERRDEFIATMRIDLLNDRLKREIGEAGWNDEVFHTHMQTFIARSGLAEEFIDYLESQAEGDREFLMEQRLKQRASR